MAAIAIKRRADELAEFTPANFLALICGVVMLFAFLFLPWVGSQLTDNGARLFSEITSGAVTVQDTLFIALIPLAGLGAVGLALWGILTAGNSRTAGLLTPVTGLVALVYYASLLLQGPEGPSRDVINRPGTGLWVSFFCAIALVLLIAVVHPRVNAALSRSARAGASVMPPVPRQAIPYLFLLVPLILYLIWIIIPTFATFYLSLTNWDGVSTPGFVGLKNFERLFRSRDFAEALSNNARWLAVFITVPTTLGLGLALIFNTEMRGGRWYKVSFYSPLVLSLPVIGLVWAWVYHPSLGLLNTLLRNLGIADPPGWLADRQLAIWCIIIAAVWRQVGYVMILYLAGLKNIDPSFIDAAMVDGASRWNMFRHVVLPLLAPVTTIIIVISIIDSLRAFDLVQIMTRGGQSTQVLANLMFMRAFNDYEMGYGAAIAVILFLISLIFIIFYLRRVVRDELQY